MSDHDVSVGEPEGGTAKAECEHALERIYTFLDNELDQASASVVRHHLAACEPCVDAFDLELVMRSVIRRSCGHEPAPAELRRRIIVSMTTVKRDV